MNPDQPAASGFDLGQLGLDVQIVPTLTDPEGLGIWISEQPAPVQAAIVHGWITAYGDAAAMLAATRVGRELRDNPTYSPSWYTPTLEHLLRTLRTMPTAVEGATDAQPE